MGEFNDKVYETVRRVPRGKVVSYGQVARLIGASTCGLASGMAGTRGARTAARRPLGRPRRRSISIGPLSWANKRLVLRRLS